MLFFGKGVGTPFRAMTDLTVRFTCEDQEQRVAATCVATRGNEINDAPAFFKRRCREWLLADSALMGMALVQQFWLVLLCEEIRCTLLNLNIRK